MKPPPTPRNPAPGPAIIPGFIRDTLSPMRRTPLVGHLVYYGVIGGLVVAEVIEPLPTALLMVTAHFFLGNGNPALREAGQALDV